MNEDRYILYLQGRGFSDTEYWRLPIITQIIRKMRSFYFWIRIKEEKNIKEYADKINECWNI